MVSLAGFRTQSPASVKLKIYDVIGKDSPNVANLIAHVGLSALDGDCKCDRVPVFHMRPPLRTRDQARESISCNAVGTIDLSDAEFQKIRTFIDRYAGEHQLFQDFKQREILSALPQMYCVYPHMSELREEDGRYSRMRFSCVGFVFEAYKAARITLLSVEMLPPAQLSDAKVAYGPEIALMERLEMPLEGIGLKGDGPWPIMFCGYVFHSLDRETDQIRSVPFVPTIAHREFASERRSKTIESTAPTSPKPTSTQIDVKWSPK